MKTKEFYDFNIEIELKMRKADLFNHKWQFWEASRQISIFQFVQRNIKIEEPTPVRVWKSNKVSEGLQVNNLIGMQREKEKERWNTKHRDDGNDISCLVRAGCGFIRAFVRVRCYNEVKAFNYLLKTSSCPKYRS